MKMSVNVMLVLSEAISKGAKPWYSAEGEKMLAEFIQHKEAVAQSKATA